MYLSRYIFSVVISLPFILLFNLLLISCLIVLVNEGLHVECVTQVKQLRLETLSSLLIVWGVILESREHILESSPKLMAKRLAASSTQNDIELYGISLIALGLILEVIDYVNSQFQLNEFNLIALEVSALVQWIVFVIILSDTTWLSWKLFSVLWESRRQNA